MKYLLTFFLSGFFLLFLGSCAVIGGIFKAGMGFGIFLVLGVIVLIVVLLTRTRKK